VSNCVFLTSDSSARPSPTGTPVKSQSEASLSNTAIGDYVVTSMSAESRAVHDQRNAASVIKDEKLNINKDEATMGALDYSNLAIAPISEPGKADALATGEESISKKKQQDKKKNKKSTSKSESEEISSPTETFSDLADVASPTTTEIIEYLTSQNTNISFSNSSSYSSSRKPSFASRISDTSLSTTSAPQQQNGDGDSSLCRNTAEEDTDFNMNSTPVHIKSNSNVSFSNRSTPKPRSASGKQRQHNHTKKSSTASTISNGSVRKADSKASKADQNTTALASKSTIGETSSITFNTSTIMEGSEWLKGKKELDKDILTPTKSAKGSAVSVSDGRKENKHPTSPGILDDASQWPALGPAKSPLSSIADGKPPPQVPIALPLAQRVASSGKPIMPALPLIKTRRPS
jgi:hypothetical protein